MRRPLSLVGSNLQRPPAPLDQSLCIVVNRLLTANRPHLMSILAELVRPTRDWSRIREATLSALRIERELAMSDAERAFIDRDLAALEGDDAERCREVAERPSEPAS